MASNQHHKEFISLFSPAIHNLVLRGRKVSNSDFISMYNMVMELTQDKPIIITPRSSGAAINNKNQKDNTEQDHPVSLSSEREQDNDEMDSCTLLNQSIHEEILKVLHQQEDLKIISNIEMLEKLWIEKIKPLDSFLKRLFNGRNYFMNKFPMAVVLGSQLFEEICRQMFDQNLDISSSPPSPPPLVVDQHNMYVHDHHHHNMENSAVSIKLPTIIGSELLNQFLLQLEEYYMEKTTREAVKYKLQQTPIPRHKFTRTKNLLHNIEGDLGINFSNMVDGNLLSRVDIPLSKECCQFEDPVAFYIDNVLTEEECQEFIEKTEKIGFRTLEHEFLSYERDNDRALLIFPYFADLVWNRIRPVLEKDDKLWNQQRPFGWHNEGKWNPSSINHCMRTCRYNGPCVGFTPHRDGNFVQSVNERSKFTIIIYLNDNFEDGTTDFLRAHEPATMGELVKEEIKRGFSLEYSLKPKKGRVLIFDHALLHQGRPIPNGHKYIIRTDIVLKRVDNPQPDMSYLQDPDYHKMLYLYKAAANYECHGFVETSSELYERALSLRMHYPRRKKQEE